MDEVKYKKGDMLKILNMMDKLHIYSPVQMQSPLVQPNQQEFLLQQIKCLIRRK